MTPTTAFTIDRKSFADSVGKVARYLPVRPPVPVLGGILVEVDALGVTLTVTDLENTARTFATADVEQPGRFLVLGEHLTRIVRNLPDGLVRVECDGRGVTLASGTATFRLLTMPTEDYPDMSEVIDQWRNIDAMDGNPDAPTCRVVDMEGVKPAPADGHERGLYAKRGLATTKMWRSPGRASRLYEPTDLQPGAWITWTRDNITRYYGPKGTMTHSEEETTTMTGQVWSAADSPRSVWAIVEGEDKPALVREWTPGRRSSREHAVLTETVCVDIKEGATVAA
jgi:hypothetical protein